MKIKYYILIILIFSFIFYSYQNQNNINAGNFDYTINGSNVLCYNKSIDKNEIRNFIKYYNDKVNQFYVNTGLTTKRIELEPMIIILCINSFKEWEQEKICKEKIKKELNYYNTSILDKMVYTKELDENPALFYFNFDVRSILPIIVVKSYDYDIMKYFYLIVEYNHYLIANNYYYKHIGRYYEIFNDFVFQFYFNEGITCYFGSYFNTITYYEYIDKFDEYLKNDKMKLKDEDAKIMLNLYKDKLFLNKNYNFFKYVNIINTNNINGNDTYNNELSKHAKYIVFFNAYLHYSRGTEKFYEYLRYLYNEYYNSKEEIFLNCFNISFEDFLKEIDQYVLQN
jgi:hypothetical protein